MLVYTVDHSLYCAKLRILMRHKGLDWTEAPPPGGGGSDKYLSLVPSGNIPALVDGKLTLTDSEAIAEYLEEKHPDLPMLPGTINARALSRERSRFHDTRLEPALRLTFPHVDPKKRKRAAITNAHTQINKQLRALGALLQFQKLPRDRLWMGDCGLVVTLEWLILMEHVVFPALDWPEAVVSYIDEMTLHAAVSSELHAYRPSMQHYMTAKNAYGPSRH
jgi:glutathione S-transferase